MNLAETILERIEILQDIQKSDGGSTGVNRKDILREIKKTLEESNHPYKEEVDKDDLGVYENYKKFTDQSKEEVGMKGELQKWFDQHEYSPKSIKDIGDNYVINSSDVKELLATKK